MSSLRDLLTDNPLASADRQLKLRDSKDFYSQFLSKEPDDIWSLVLHRFISSKPWKYWDVEALHKSLQILENAPERTISALSQWSEQVGIGFENSFRLSSLAEFEGTINDLSAQSLIRLATEFHPEYLRFSEHIFGNLLTFYWAVLKKGSVSGNFKLRNAISLIQSKGHGFLLSGYDERIRNAIAHGEVVFSSLGIQYGPKSNHTLSISDFLRKFDSLIRTSNLLEVTLLMFLARNQNLISSDQLIGLPPSVLSLIAGASVERPGLEVIGAIKSNMVLNRGTQLHISIKSSFKSRAALLHESARLAMHLLDRGASTYSRYLFEIDCGEEVLSLIEVQPAKLANLLTQNASIDRLSEMFGETQLLWFNESNMRWRIRGWRIIFSSHWKLAKLNFWDNIKNAGLSRARGRYEIRKVENLSSDGVPKVKAIVVLKYPADSEDNELIKEIAHFVIKRFSYRWINSNAGNIKKTWGYPRRPRYISISLYRLDGTLRWLSSGGWPEGNLILVAEKIRGSRRKPIFVPNAEEIWRGIRFRYSMDTEEAKEALDGLKRLRDQFLKSDSKK